MQIVINNSDYTVWLDGVRPLTIERKLNQPSTCRFWVTGQSMGAGFTVPQRNQGITVKGDDGTVYFTGYVAVSPLGEYAGLGVGGPVYRYELQAISDEVLLDTQLLPSSAGVSGGTAAQLVAGLVARSGVSQLDIAGVVLNNVVGHFSPQNGARFSDLAGEVAGQARGAYRALGGALSLASVGTVVHVLDEGGGTLSLQGLSLTPAVERALANDVTVCGEYEPVEYVTEYFLGDGVSLSFLLSAIPYFGPVSGERIIRELFDEAAIDLRRWSYAGHEGYFSLTGGGPAGGLQINGGTGRDGDATLVWNDQVEAGGTLLLEAIGVTLSPGSVGMLAGLYSGQALGGNCLAGFQVTAAAGTGAVSVEAVVEGVVAGPSFAINAANQYTLRTRLSCPEVERTTQTYRVAGDAGVVAFGGGGVIAAGRVLMEVEEFVNGVGGVPVVVYDGGMSLLPASVSVAAASSINLIGTIRAIEMKSLGTGWVQSVPAGQDLATAQTRRLGARVDSAECYLTGRSGEAGALVFYLGGAPALGERLMVRYRSLGRAVGRAINAGSQAALAAAGFPASSVWTGTVTQPAARSSRDCRNAALALVTAASSVSAAWSGSYRSSNQAMLTAGNDVWPGDALLLLAPSLPVAGGGTLDTQVVVRSVKLEYGASQPDLVQYTIGFSNDWANDLAVKTSRAVAADAWLPAAVGLGYLGNLNALAVTAISATAITVAANATLPAGGGFEVRRRDFCFQAGQDPDLVLRTTTTSFDIPRATESDRFYMRMYDGNVPPNYSEFSVGLFLNLPLS